MKDGPLVPAWTLLGFLLAFGRLVFACFFFVFVLRSTCDAPAWLVDLAGGAWGSYWGVFWFYSVRL